MRSDVPRHMIYRIAVGAVAVSSLLSRAASANDAAFSGWGGSMKPMKGEHPAVQMVREWVTIDLYGYQPVVDCTFIFHNHGPAATVTMGFPESGGGDGSDRGVEHTDFDSFATWVDGLPVRTVRKLTEHDDEEYTAYFVKQVHFNAGQTRRVRVHYEGGGGASSSGDHNVGYDFTGGNWRGVVEESLLTLNLHGPGTYWIDRTPDPDAKRVAANEPVVTRRGNSFIYRWGPWQAQRGFGLNYGFRCPNWLSSYDGPQPESLHFVAAHHCEIVKIGSGSPQATLLDPMVCRTEAYLDHGVAMVDLGRLCEWPLYRLSGHNARVVPRTVGAKTSIVAGRHRFEWRRGSRVMLHNGRRITLPVAPRYVGDRVLVPLAALLKPLGAWAQIDASHMIKYHLPGAKRGQGDDETDAG